MTDAKISTKTAAPSSKLILPEGPKESKLPPHYVKNEDRVLDPTLLDKSALERMDKEKFQDKPWCKTGDWVIFARYAGSRFRIEGGEVRILNDDEVLASILDPEDILHF